MYTRLEGGGEEESVRPGLRRRCGAQDYIPSLMNGVSHMLPFVVGGGILIALAFLIDGLCVDVNSLAR